jgi:hypothetical protein
MNDTFFKRIKQKKIENNGINTHKIYALFYMMHHSIFIMFYNILFCIYKTKKPV